MYEELIKGAWNNLKQRVCSDPKKAKRCVMVSEADFTAALSDALASRLEERGREGAEDALIAAARVAQWEFTNGTPAAFHDALVTLRMRAINLPTPPEGDG